MGKGSTKSEIKVKCKENIDKMSVVLSVDGSKLRQRDKERKKKYILVTIFMLNHSFQLM